MNMLNPPNTANTPQTATPAHLLEPTEIPQPRQGRHIPTPGVAQRNPGIQTPQQNKPLKGVTLPLLPPFPNPPELGILPSLCLMPSAFPIPYPRRSRPDVVGVMPFVFYLLPYALCPMPYIPIPTCFTHREICHKPTPLPTKKKNSKQTHLKNAHKPLITRSLQ
jgi:hypothetical protein